MGSNKFISPGPFVQGAKYLIGIESDLTYVGLNSAHVGVLEVEQTCPCRPLHLQETLSQHRGAKPIHQCELFEWISLLSPR